MKRARDNMQNTLAVVGEEMRHRLLKAKPQSFSPQFGGTERWLAAVNKMKSSSLAQLPVDVYRTLLKQTAGPCTT